MDNNDSGINEISGGTQKYFNYGGQTDSQNESHEIQDIYDSEEGGFKHMGIPAAQAFTSHQMNENILNSFFPQMNNKDNISSNENGLDEEAKKRNRNSVSPSARDQSMALM